MNRIEELKQKVAENDYDCWYTSALGKDVIDKQASEAIQYLLSRLETAEKALTKVEWIGANSELSGVLECSYCGHGKEDGHSEDCLVNEALQKMRE